MDLGLRGKTAVVTGASKGLGRAIAIALAEEGCSLHLAARSADLLDGLANELRGRCQIAVATHALDLATGAGQAALIEACAERADILVNNAGAIPSGELDQLSEAQWREGWELKVMGYVNLTRGFYAAMKARGDGVILNIIGLAGVRPDATYIAGATGNAALIAFTRALGARSVDFGVRVLGINPSLTASDRAERILAFKAEQSGEADFKDRFLAKLPFSRMGSPEEIAAATAFLASPRSGYTSGTVLNIDGGTNARP